jgi:hypothetical protein
MMDVITLHYDQGLTRARPDVTAAARASIVTVRRRRVTTMSTETERSSFAVKAGLAQVRFH